jgi:hypothetical protein
MADLNNKALINPGRIKQAVIALAVIALGVFVYWLIFIRGTVSYPSWGQEEALQEGKDFLEDSRRIIQNLQREGYSLEILFLDSSDAVLMRRYSETRREHPLAVGGPIREGIHLERERLQGIRDMANQVIDTSHFNVHQLKEKIQRYAQEGSSSSQMTVHPFFPSDTVWDSLRSRPLIRCSLLTQSLLRGEPEAVEWRRPQSG